MFPVGPLSHKSLPQLLGPIPLEYLGTPQQTVCSIPMTCPPVLGIEVNISITKFRAMFMMKLGVIKSTCYLWVQPSPQVTRFLIILWMDLAMYQN